jgi:hypothetical protein
MSCVGLGNTLNLVLATSDASVSLVLLQFFTFTVLLTGSLLPQLLLAVTRRLWFPVATPEKLIDTLVLAVVSGLAGVPPSENLMAAVGDDQVKDDAPASHETEYIFVEFPFLHTSDEPDSSGFGNTDFRVSFRA